MTALKILSHLLAHADEVKPHEAEEIAEECGLKRTTTYHALNILRENGFVRHVPGGYVLGKEILLAGAKYHAAIAKLNINNAQEKLYGSAD